VVVVVVVVGRVGRAVVVVEVDSKTCLYLMDGRGVLWFDKSFQSTGFLILDLVIFSPTAPTNRILKHKN
jgi:hypothetical protein